MLLPITMPMTMTHKSGLSAFAIYKGPCSSEHVYDWILYALIIE